MNYREFVGAAEVHLRMAGWLMQAHNGVWRKYKKAGSSEVIPLPGAIAADLRMNSMFSPQVELYLTSNGWRRTSSGVSAGWPSYKKGDETKRLPEALLKQLMSDRFTNSVVEPHTTPSEMRQLLDVRTYSPPPSSRADTTAVRR